MWLLGIRPSCCWSAVGEGQVRGGRRGQGAVIILVTLTRESHSHTSTRSTEVLSFDINMLPHTSQFMIANAVLLKVSAFLLYTLKIS